MDKQALFMWMVRSLRMDHAEMTDQALLEFEHQTDLSLQDIERIGSELHALSIMYDTY